MRKLLLSTTMLCLLLAFGCKKDKNETLKDKITGRWKFESVRYISYVDDKVIHDETDTDYTDDDYIEFKSDGTISSSDGNEANGRYTVENDNRTITITPAGDNTAVVYTISRIDNEKFYFSTEYMETIAGVSSKEVQQINLTK